MVNAHRLNLVMNGVMRCCTEIRNTLGLLEELHTFMNGHRRHDVFQRSQNECRHRMQLKRVLTTRWNSTESAVETAMARYSEILTTLSELAESSLSDSETVTAAFGLRKRLKDIRVIISMEILKLVYTIIGPASRILQGTTIDMAAAVVVLEDCARQFNSLRQNADSTWKEIYDKSVSFASSHGVSTDFPFERRRAKKKMADELCEDEHLVGLNKFKTETLITVLDEANQQMFSRFKEQNLIFMRQLAIFTPKILLSDRTINTTDIEIICNQYGVDSCIVAAELSDFRKTYRLLSDGEDGFISKTMTRDCCDQTESGDAEDVDPGVARSSDDDNAEADSIAESDSKLNSATQWKNYAFMKPLRILSQLSGYPNLLMLYSIVACLAVSSTSAERALSKLKIIKNRLRSTLADDYLSALMIIASEKDLLRTLTDKEIILSVAMASPTLKSQLLY